MSDSIKVRTMIIDFEPIGSFQLFAFQDAEDAAKGAPVNFAANIYWRDFSSPRGYGPFTSVAAAMEHYKNTVLALSSYLPSRPEDAPKHMLDIGPIKDNIIDFLAYKTKRQGMKRYK